jgi:predicted ester cyclase
MSVIAGFPDIKWTIEDIISEGDKVVVRWHWNGTNTAPFRGIPPSNKTVIDNANVIYQLKDGKIVNAWIQGDRLGVLTQIGLIPEGLIPSPQPQKKDE